MVDCEQCDRSGYDRFHLDGNPGNNDPDNLVILCRSCRAKAQHARRRGYRQMDYQAAADWRRETLAGACAVCGERDRLHGHHVIPQQTLRREAAPPPGFAFEVVRWDRRNLLVLCETHHRQHHTRQQPIPRQLLAPEAWQFAEDYGLAWALERIYPEALAA